MESKLIYSATEDDRLIGEIQEHIVLYSYDSAYPKHKDGVHKDCIWNKISETVGRTSKYTYNHYILIYIKNNVIIYLGIIDYTYSHVPIIKSKYNIFIIPA